MTEKKQQHKKKRGKVQHIRGSPKKRKISGKAVFSSESIPGKMLADVKNLITDKVSELKRADQKKLFLANFPYLMFAYFFNKIAWLYRVNTGATSWDKFMNTIIEALNGYLMDLAKEQIKLAFEQAQKEVDDLHQRTKEGIETARLNGKQIGGVKGKKLTTKKSIEKKAEILKHSIDFGGSLKDSDCMKLTGLARNTFYKYKRELKEEAALH